MGHEVEVEVEGEVEVGVEGNGNGNRDGDDSGNGDGAYMKLSGIFFIFRPPFSRTPSSASFSFCFFRCSKNSFNGLVQRVIGAL